jgi:hypothetical protein
MKTVTTVTDRKAIIRPMFVCRVVKPPLAVGHRSWLKLGDASGPRLAVLRDRQISVCRRCRGAIAIAGGSR